MTSHVKLAPSKYSKVYSAPNIHIGCISTTKDLEVYLTGRDIRSPLLDGNYKCTYGCRVGNPNILLCCRHHRFKDCLKSAKTKVSDMIGKLFFNIAKTKCFSFKREKTCKKRSWWGKCLKTKKSKKAFFKAGISY